MTTHLDRPVRGYDNGSPSVALALDGVVVRHRDGTNDDGTPRFHTALDGATMTALPATFTAVVGPSGSGKSTLLSVASGMLVPDGGSVTVAGARLNDLDDAARTSLRREHVGIVFQQPNLMASLNSVEQLLLPAHVAGLRGRALGQRRERARELLELVGLARQQDRRPHQLSGGQRQRVAIARALMGRPSLLLVDEPTSALDEDASRAVVELLHRVTGASGPATVMVTHDAQLVGPQDHLVEVHDGRLSQVR